MFVMDAQRNLGLLKSSPSINDGLPKSLAEYIWWRKEFLLSSLAYLSRTLLFSSGLLLFCKIRRQTASQTQANFCLWPSHPKGLVPDLIFLSTDKSDHHWRLSGLLLLSVGDAKASSSREVELITNDRILNRQQTFDLERRLYYKRSIYTFYCVFKYCVF